MDDFYNQLCVIINKMLEHLEKGELSLLYELSIHSQTLFREQLLISNDCESNFQSHGQLQSIHTEISKELRLLGNNVMLLKAAKSKQLFDERNAQVGACLNRLLRYCEMALGQKDI